VPVSFTQTDFRFRNDDGTEATATWKANANTNISVDVSAGNVNVRVRIAAQEVGTTAATFAASLFMSKNGGAYAAVTDVTTDVLAVDSANLTDNNATTQQITAFTFVAGRVDDVNGAMTATGSIVQNSGTEFEWMLRLAAANLSNGDTLDFEVYRSGSAIATYTQVGRITIVKAPAINVSDSSTVTESKSLTVGTSQVNVSDTVAAAESKTVAIVTAINVNDAVAVTESKTVAIVTEISVSDAVAVTESLTLTISTLVNVSDAISLTDAAAVALADLAIPVTDGVTLADAPALSVETAQVYALDNISAAEAIAISLDALMVSGSDAVVVSEAVAAFIDILVSPARRQSKAVAGQPVKARPYSAKKLP
jgi:hypothetical protein